MGESSIDLFTYPHGGAAWRFTQERSSEAIVLEPNLMPGAAGPAANAVKIGAAVVAVVVAAADEGDAVAVDVAAAPVPRH